MEIPLKVFFSHSQENREIAAGLARALKSLGVETEELQTQTAEKAVREADAILVLIDPEKNVQRRLRREWSLILQALWDNPNKKVLPLRIDQAPVPAFLKSLHPISIARETDEFGEIAGQVVQGLADESRRYQPERHSLEDDERWHRRLDKIRLGTSALPVGD